VHSLAVTNLRPCARTSSNKP